MDREDGQRGSERERLRERGLRERGLRERELRDIGRERVEGEGGRGK